MKRPSIPEEIYEAVEEESRSYENWRETLVRLLEQEAGLEIAQTAEVQSA